MLRRKSQLQGDVVKPQASRVSLERAKLTQERNLALRRNDKEEVARLDIQLAELAVESPPVQLEPAESSSALLAKVNERNRKANHEAIRRAELQEAERKRRERRLGTPTIVDPSARLRTVPRMFASRYEFPSLLMANFRSSARLRSRRVLRSGLPRQIQAVHPRQTRRPRHRGRLPSRVHPRVLPGRAISTRVFSMPSRLIWATFDVFLLSRLSSFCLVMLPSCALYVVCRV